MSRNWSNGVGAVVILTLAVGQAAAQQPGQNQPGQDQPQGQPTQQSQQRSQGGQAGQLDKHLAKLLISKNEAEIKLSEMGQQQAQNQQVKEFASKMVDDHRQLNQELQKVAGTSQSSGRQLGQQQQQQQQQQRPGSSQSGDAAEQLVQMYDRIESQFIQKLTQGLKDKQGQQFDNTFMGLQVLGHMRMVESLDVMQQQASGELQQILQKAHQKTQQHLEEAEQLSQQLEESAVAQRPQPGQQRPQR